ncbi:entericidin A/B family lipoprotein [Phycisphaeraceae bacterium D3-23]
MLKIRNWSILLLGVAAFALAGCNTLQGAGEDVEDAGEAVQDAAD